ncbi:Fucoxanthin-chlorophyll a-c binding protein F [Durusdinium trenchii]|uniref:Chloroplastic n=1 Tax=Durusdinium trenchii TaxID=1381693 RepID=A0ABP0JQG2_9DINO
MSNRHRGVACGAALTGAFLAAPSFLAPNGQTPSVPRVQGIVSYQAQGRSPGSAIPGLAVAGVATSALAALKVGKTTSKTSRHFFGGTSPATFDPATQLGVQGFPPALGSTCQARIQDIPTTMLCGGRVLVEHAPNGACVLSRALAPPSPNFWDPLGLSADKDEATFKRRRAVEIKHGRIAMYATMGYIVPEYFKFPGYLSPSLGLKFSDVPNGLAALSKVPVLGGAQIIAFCGLIETTGFFQAASTTDGRGPREGQFAMKDSTESAEPGNYGVGFPTFLGKVEDPETRKSKLAAELANGRLAMMAIIGMFFQDGLTGSAWGDWSLYTASPLRAGEEAPTPPPFDPAKQVGAMEPLGFFDPAGFSKVGDKENFQNLRAAEIKHGRVAMMAALGAVVQHYVKFPGFESVPAGIGAVTTPPGTYGFAALLLLSGAMELAVWTQDPNKEAGDFGDPLGLGQYNEEFRNKELNNGRFAMFAALGIISADLLTGKDAIQQFS